MDDDDDFDPHEFDTLHERVRDLAVSYGIVGWLVYMVLWGAAGAVAWMALMWAIDRII